jgi:octanoyl-[GcvH]:protein N-octanoyltransferase
MLKEAFSSSSIVLLNRTNLSFSGRVIDSFALDETLCQEIGSSNEASYIHMWIHKPSIVLGSSDSKLQKIHHGIARTIKQGYDVCVRPSGGAAVILDEGVLNLSFILPINENSINFNHGYGLMVEFIRHVLDPFHVNIDTGEIKGSYCPGAYDVSIGGKKFCGIAQRRRTSGFAVQAFIMLNGSGKARSQLIKEFYDYSGTKGIRFPILMYIPFLPYMRLLVKKYQTYSAISISSNIHIVRKNKSFPADRLLTFSTAILFFRN